MREFKGLYLGISPTDESAIGMGEMELVIDDTNATLRLATGLEIYEETILLDNLRPMTQDEILMDDENPSDVEYRGFKEKGKAKDECGFALIFAIDPTLRDPCVFMSLGMADLLGPTMLWSKRRILHMMILKSVLAIGNLKYRGGIPRLAHAGRTKQHRAQMSK